MLRSLAVRFEQCPKVSTWINWTKNSFKNFCRHHLQSFFERMAFYYFYCSTKLPKFQFTIVSKLDITIKRQHHCRIRIFGRSCSTLSRYWVGKLCCLLNDLDNMSNFRSTVVSQMLHGNYYYYTILFCQSELNNRIVISKYAVSETFAITYDWMNLWILLIALTNYIFFAEIHSDAYFSINLVQTCSLHYLFLP